MAHAGDSAFLTRIHQSLASSRGKTARALALAVVFFLVSLVIPFIIPLGGLRLSIYRIILIMLTVPLVLMWLRGVAGRKRLADFALLLLCVWMSLSLAVVENPARAIEAGGIFFCETFGAFLLGRCMVRNAENYRRVCIILFWIVILLLPFAVIEATTGWNMLLDTMDSIWPSYGRIQKEPRWGLDRVQATFEHPILFGVFCGSVIGLAYMVLGHGKSFFRRIGLGLVVLLTAGLSLSAGPLTGMIVQLGMAIWNELFRKFRNRWKVLAALTAVAYAIIEIGSNRSASAVFISYFSFNEFSAYMRIHIWNFGTMSIMNHPLFGIGFGEWFRPPWMSNSIDMFWIVFGVRHGIPAMALTLLSFFAVYLPVVLRKNLPERESNYRLGVVFTLTAFFLTGWTVHYWNATYALYMFTLGAALWFLDVPDKDASVAHDYDTGDSAPPAQTSRYTRFPYRHSLRGAALVAACGLAALVVPSQAVADDELHVTDAAGLLRALNATNGAARILLADGDYGALRIEGQRFDPPVTLRSERGRGARFAAVAISGTRGLRIESVHVDNPGNGDPGAALVLVSERSRDIVFRDSEVNGRVDNDFSGFAALQTGGGVRDVTFADNSLHDVRRGGLFVDATGLVVQGNTVDRIGEDSFKFIAVHDVLIENNAGARFVFPEKGAHLDFIQFQGTDSSGIFIRGNVSLPGNAAAATTQGIFLDDAHYTDVLIERNIIVTGMIRGISLSSGTGVVARYNTVLDVAGIGSKATKVMVDGESYGNIMGSYPNDKELGAGRNLVLQQSAPDRNWHYDSVFRNAGRGVGITLDDLRPVLNSLASRFGAYSDGPN